MRACVVACALGVGLVVCPIPFLRAQDSTDTPQPWYDRLSIRGYAQVRYNRLLETNENLECSTCDRSIGGDGGFLLRRARLIISGDVTDRISFSIQSDFASEVGGRENSVLLRHYYADLYLDAERSIRARIGQSEVTTGFEGIQSSSRRGPFDRADAMESAAPGEQDLGVFLLWTPRVARQRFGELANDRYKGTSDYGVVSLGVYNGQGGNRAEMNDEPHVVARVAYPFLIRGKQYVELGAHAYAGTYTVTESQRGEGVGGDADFNDRRVGAAVVVFPQPFGLQAEWTIGRGPQYDAPSNSIVDKPVRGGYAILSYSLVARNDQRLHAYVRGQYFNGAFKTEPDARSSVVREYEPGLEWSLGRGLELTAAYAISDRHYRDSSAPDNRQKGRFLRLQAQFSF